MSRTKKQKSTGGKAVDSSCGNNKGCPVCEGNRLHKHKKRIMSQDTDVNQILDKKRIEQ